MSYKVINISNPGTSIKFGGDDGDLKSKLLNGTVSGIPAVTIKSSNKWGFWDNILWVENQAATKKTTIRGQSNSPSTDVDLALPPTTTNDTLAAIGLQNVFSVKQELDAGTLFKEMTEPSTPSSGFLHLYMEAGHLKRKNSAGSVTDYDNIAAGIPINFPDLSIKLRNPANTFDTTLKHAAITAARQLNMPLTTATDTLVTLGLSQTFTDLITFKKDSSTNIGLFRDNNANGSQIGMNFDAKNSASTQTTFARWRGEIEDNTAGSEDGNMLLYLKKAGSDSAVAVFKNNYIQFNGTTLDVKSTSGQDEVMQLINPINTVGEAAGLNFNLNNSSDAETNYGSMYCAIVANTAGAVSARFSFWARQAGVARNVFQIQSDGRLDCGGINRRVQLADTNLTAARIFTFPDVDTKLAGLSSVNTFLKGQEIEEDKNTLDHLVLKQKTNVVGDYAVISSQIKNSSSAYFTAGWMKWQLGVNTAGAESTDFSVIVRNAGSSITAFRIKNDGMLECGGPNKRITFDETGLTTARTFTFANITDIINPKTLSISNPYTGGGTSPVLVRTGIYPAISDTACEGHLNSGATVAGTGSALNDTTQGRGRAFATGAVANANAGLRWTTVSFRREWTNYMILRVSFSSTSDIRVFIGWSSDTAEIAGETTLNNFSGCGVGKRTGDTNWFTMRNDGDATEDRVDTGVTFATTAVTIQLELDATSFRSKIGSTTNTAQTTEIPASTTMLAPHVQIETGAGAADKTINIFPIWTSIGGQVMI